MISCWDGRDPAGNKLPDFTGTWRRNDGTIEQISARDITQDQLHWWTSPKGQRYPIARSLPIGPYHVHIGRGHQANIMKA